MSSKRSRWSRAFRRGAAAQSETLMHGTGKVEKLVLPESEKTVLKTVPAMAGDEVIGTTVIYEDGTMDILVNEGISKEAREALHGFRDTMFSLEDDGYKIIYKEGDPDGLPEQVDGARDAAQP